MKNILEGWKKIGFVILALSVLPGCATVANNNPVPEKTHQENVQNTEQWKTFFDSDFGLNFSYPQSFQVSSEVLNYNDASKYDPKDFQGKEKRIRLESEAGSITIFGYTKDLRHFYGEKFVGGDLDEFCNKEGITEKDFGVQVCKKRILPETSEIRKYILSHEFSSPECSPFVSSNFFFNNPNKNSEYTGIVVSTQLPSVSKEIGQKFFTDPGCNPPKDFDSFLKNRLLEILNNKNVTKEDEQLFNIMHGILNSFRSLHIITDLDSKPLSEKEVELLYTKVLAQKFPIQRYGFSVDVPKDWEVYMTQNPSRTYEEGIELRKKNNMYETISINIESVEFAPSLSAIQMGEGIIHTKDQLKDIGERIKNDPKSKIIDGVPVLNFIGYYPPGGDIVAYAQFFYKDQLVTFSYGLPQASFGLNLSVEEKKKLIETRIKEFENGLGDEQNKERLRLFNTIIDSLQIQN